MKLPQWVIAEFEKLPPGFTGAITVQIFDGGATAVEGARKWRSTKPKGENIQTLKVGGTD